MAIESYIFVNVIAASVTGHNVALKDQDQITLCGFWSVSEAIIFGLVLVSEWKNSTYKTSVDSVNSVITR